MLYRQFSARGFPCVLIAAIALAAGPAGGLVDELRADGQQAVPKEAARDVLLPLQFLVGGWRGTGIPKRGSKDGAWQESGEIRWDFDSGEPMLKWSPDCGKLLRLAEFHVVQAGPSEAPILQLTTHRPDGSQQVYYSVAPVKTTAKALGKSSESPPLVFESAGANPGDSKTDAADTRVHRVTLNRLSENRHTWLFESRPANQTFFTRTAEVAYQRAGTRLEAGTARGPECIVTGGEGTMTVMHAGKTYYVCCTGCRDAFLADPEGILKEAAERIAKAKAESAK